MGQRTRELDVTLGGLRHHVSKLAELAGERRFGVGLAVNQADFFGFCVNSLDESDQVCLVGMSRIATQRMDFGSYLVLAPSSRTMSVS